MGERLDDAMALEEAADGMLEYEHEEEDAQHDDYEYDDEDGEFEGVWSCPQATGAVAPTLSTQSTGGVSGCQEATGTSTSAGHAGAAGPSVGTRMDVGIKAGMESVDKDKINAVIAQVSAGSRFWKNEVGGWVIGFLLATITITLTCIYTHSRRGGGHLLKQY